MKEIGLSLRTIQYSYSILYELISLTEFRARQGYDIISEHLGRGSIELTGEMQSIVMMSVTSTSMAPSYEA